MLTSTISIVVYIGWVIYKYYSTIKDYLKTVKEEGPIFAFVDFVGTLTVLILLFMQIFQWYVVVVMIIPVYTVVHNNNKYIMKASNLTTMASFIFIVCRYLEIYGIFFIVNH